MEESFETKLVRKQKATKQRTLYAIGLTVILILIIIAAVKTKTENKEEKQKAAELAIKLTAKADSIEKAKNSPEYKQNLITQANLACDQLLIQLNEYEVSEYFSDPFSGVSRIEKISNDFMALKGQKLADSEKIKKLEAAIKKKKSTVFPKLRTAYGLLLKEKLWEENIKVEQSGKTLTLIGVTFANNKNVKTAHEAIEHQLHDFRFKRINYLWIEHDDEYNYMDLISKEDTDF